jgi:hypothetical protein
MADDLQELVFARFAERDLAQAVAELVATRSENPPGGEDAMLADPAARWGFKRTSSPSPTGAATPASRRMTGWTTPNRATS